MWTRHIALYLPNVDTMFMCYKMPIWQRRQLAPFNFKCSHIKLIKPLNEWWVVVKHPFKPFLYPPAESMRLPPSISDDKTNTQSNSKRSIWKNFGELMSESLIQMWLTPLTIDWIDADDLLTNHFVKPNIILYCVQLRATSFHHQIQATNYLVDKAFRSSWIIQMFWQ